MIIGRRVVVDPTFTGPRDSHTADTAELDIFFFGELTEGQGTSRR